jgi:GNAT superfamily N-acetyltransferase
MESWPYRGARDLRLVQELCARLWSTSSYWHAGGLAWHRCSHADREAEWPTRLWGEPDRLSAWAWLELPGHLMAQLDEVHPELAAQIVDWFEGTATGPDLLATVPDGYEVLTEALRRAGFREREDAPYSLDMRCAPLERSAVEVPAGYAFRPVTRAEVGRRVGLHRAIWSRLADGAHVTSRVTVERFRQVSRTWPFRQDLDLVAVAPDGSFAASCLAWLDPDTRTAELEPVGTHPKHRGRGLATALCVDALQRLGVAGAEDVTVHPRGDPGYPAPRRIYERAGFKVVNRTRIFERLRDESAG